MANHCLCAALLCQHPLGHFLCFIERAVDVLKAVIFHPAIQIRLSEQQFPPVLKWARLNLVDLSSESPLAQPHIRSSFLQSQKPVLLDVVQNLGHRHRSLQELLLFHQCLGVRVLFHRAFTLRGKSSPASRMMPSVLALGYRENPRPGISLSWVLVGSLDLFLLQALG